MAWTAWPVAAALAFGVLLFAAQAADQKPMRGVALIIGNGEYEHLTTLTNPTSDAEAIEDLFDDLGFETFDARDADARKLRRAIARFVEDAEGADIAVVYYAGHGIEAGGENYLVPVDADIASLDDAADKLVPLNAFLKDLRDAVPMSIMLLDACRNNPFPAGSVVRETPDAPPRPLAAAGLGETRAVTLFKDKARKSGGTSAASDDSLGSLIGFAAEPGATALDGDPGSNSPYAAAVLRHVPAMAGEEFGTVMRMVAEEVYLKTDGRQRPWVNENLRRLLYLGSTPAPVEGAEGDILRERRQLLVNIASLPDPERRKVESVARDGGVSMDSVYGMLRALGTDAPKDPAQLEALLKEQVSKIKALEQERSAIKTTDPEITRLAALANQAISEGALNTALQLHDQAKARVREVETTVDDAEADIKARRLEFADVYGRSGEANFAAFNYEQSALDYEQAFLQAERWDDFAAWSYRGNQAKSLMESGWQGGKTDNLRKAAELAPEIVRLSERLDDRAHWALSQTFLGNTLLTLGQRVDDRSMIKRAIAAYEAALTVYVAGNPLYVAERLDVQQNLAGSLAQQGESSDPADVRDGLRKGIAMFDELMAQVPRSVDALEWAWMASAKGSAMSDLAQELRDPKMILDAAALLEQVVDALSSSPDPERSRALNHLATAYRNYGVMAKDVAYLRKAGETYDQSIALTDKRNLPVDWAKRVGNSALNLHNIYLQTEDVPALEKAISQFRESGAAQDPVALPLEWRVSHIALAGALNDLGRARKDPELLRESIRTFDEALPKFDRTREAAEWADNLSRKADARRNLAELEPDVAALSKALDEHREALGVSSTSKFADITKDIRERIGWFATSSTRLGNKVDDLEIAAVLRRGSDVLTEQKATEGLASLDAEFGRRLYSGAMKTEDLAGVEEALAAYRRALAAETNDTDLRRTTQSNVGLALVEMARIRKDKVGLPEAAEAIIQAIAITPDAKIAASDRKRLAETYDKLAEEGDPAWLKRSADAWADVLAHYGDDTPASDRAFAAESRGYSLSNLAFYAPAEAVTATKASLDAYRQALSFDITPANRQRIARNFGPLLRSAGEQANDAALLQEAVALYDQLDSPARTSADPDLKADRMARATALASLARVTQDAATFDRAIALFKAGLGDPVASPSTDWISAMAYAGALRERGYLVADPAMIQTSAAILAALQKLPPETLPPDQIPNLRTHEAESEIYLGDVANDPAALGKAIAIYRDVAAMPASAANPAYLDYVHGRLATSKLLTGELTGDVEAYKEGVALTRDLMKTVSRTDNPAHWFQLAGDAAFGISRTVRAGDTTAGTIDEAAQLARDALDHFSRTGSSDQLPYAKDATCNVLIEQGRATARRRPVEDGIRLCREAATALAAKSRPQAVTRIGKTIAYGEDVLAKM